MQHCRVQPAEGAVGVLAALDREMIEAVNQSLDVSLPPTLSVTTRSSISKCGLPTSFMSESMDRQLYISPSVYGLPFAQGKY